MWMRAGGAAVVLAAMATGCTGGASDPSGSTSPEATPTSASPSPPPSPEEQALDAYMGLWDVIVDNSRTTDPDYSQLDEYAEGQAAELAEHGLGAEAGEHVVSRGAPEHDAEVSAIEGDTAQIEDCMDSSSWLREDAETGELVEEEPEGPLLRRVEATASFDGLKWRISEMRGYEPGSC
ncbi:hypothetical protein GCM10027440_05420 [Nocardiopsis coralliicola]